MGARGAHAAVLRWRTRIYAGRHWSFWRHEYLNVDIGELSETLLICHEEDRTEREKIL
jgi:hypothetical protein